MTESLAKLLTTLKEKSWINFPKKKKIVYLFIKAKISSFYWQLLEKLSLASKIGEVSYTRFVILLWYALLLNAQFLSR